MKYKCCACGSTFKGCDIKDDFKNGIKEGFLCPKCGANIKDRLFGEVIFERNTIGKHIFNAFMVFLFTLSGTLAKYISNSLDISRWIVLGALVITLIVIYLIVNIRDLRMITNVTPTYKVNA